MQHHVERSAGLPPLAAAALVGGALTLNGIISARYSPSPLHPRLFRWYKKLDKPEITPPDLVFGAVWPVLLSGLGYGAYRLLRREPTPERNAAVALAAATLGLVTYYSKVTFGDRNLSAGIAESAALVGTATAYSAVAARTDRTAGLLGVPLALWSTFGGWLTKELARRNPRLDAGQNPSAAPATS